MLRERFCRQNHSSLKIRYWHCVLSWSNLRTGMKTSPHPLYHSYRLRSAPGLSLTSGTPPDVSGATSVVDFVTSDHAFQISNQIINAVSVPWNNKWNKLLFSLNLSDAGTKKYRRLIWSIEQISRRWDGNLLSLEIFLIKADKRLKKRNKTEN